MAGIPALFRRASSVAASYDWVDFISACGYRRFYGCGTLLAAGLSYFLTTQTLESSGPDFAHPGGGGIHTDNDGSGSELHIDFDITFQKPAIVGGGDAFVNFTVYLRNVNALSQATINIYHVTAAGVETSIGTASGDTRNSGADSAYIRECLKIALTKKSFGIGEKLRVNYVTTNTDNLVRVFHDPSSSLTYTEYSSARTIGTDFTADIPFKIST